RLKSSKMFSRLVTSAITVGFGGSVGLEAPMVVTGSAIGSNFGSFTFLDYKNRTLLLSCGAAAAISGIFNSPVAGVIFAIEVLLVDIAISSFIPLLIASVAGSLISTMLLGKEVLFYFEIQDEVTAQDFPYFLLLGILCGTLSVYFMRSSYKVEALLMKIKNDYGRLLFGGISLGIIIFLFPPIYGEGYQTIKQVLAGDTLEALNNSYFYQQKDNPVFLILFFTSLLLIKPIAAALTVGAGGSGGIFAPSLFTGGLTGLVLATVINLVWPNTISASNLTLVGMCGVMSGVMRTPLTAIFIIAEITSGYELFLPLMLVSAISYSVSMFFEKHSFYTKTLIEEGHLSEKQKDQEVLDQLALHKLLETDLLTVSPDSSLEDMVPVIRQSKRNIFPVVETDGSFRGIVLLDDIRDIMFDADKRKTTTVLSVMQQAPGYVAVNDSMRKAMKVFEESGAWNLPVLDGDRYVGFLSKSTIFNSYRAFLKRQDKSLIS
ncbi:MAG TPA: chloride channel protein, partial [Cyclobacteriaceae bacterium]|nr:chloride channel protein [Cyclobacteriaceae bacterium]